MQPTDADLVEMMTEIWDAMVRVGLTRVDTGPDTTFSSHTWIDITSPDGAVMRVVLEYDEPVAALLAETLFDLEREAVTECDANEAVGEVTNILGGNVKGMLGLSATLSLPAVVSSPLGPEPYPGATLNRVHFDSGGLRFAATLRDRQLVSSGAI